MLLSPFVLAIRHDSYFLDDFAIPDNADYSILCYNTVLAEFVWSRRFEAISYLKDNPDYIDKITSGYYIGNLVFG